MIPVLLTVENLQDANAQYKFNNGKAFFKMKDAVAIKQALGYAVFGNSTLFQGKIELSFKHDEENYILERDFAANRVKLSMNNKILTDADEINKFLTSIVGYSAYQWEEFVLSDKDAIVDSALNDINMFVKDNFANLRIDGDVLKAARERASKRLENIKAQISVLTDMYKSGSKEIVDALVTAKEDAAIIKAEMARLNDNIVETRSLLKAQAEYEKVNYQLGIEKEKEPAMMNIINSLNESDRMEKIIFLYEKNNEVTVKNQELNKEIDKLTAELAILEKDISRGEKAKAEKEKEFIFFNEQIKALNVALDESIANNAENGDIDNSVFAAAESYYVKSKERIAELTEQLVKLQEIKAIAQKELDETRKEYNNNRYNSVLRADIREGTSFENILELKKERLDELSEELSRKQKALEDFLTQRKLNLSTAENCKNEEKALLTEGGYEKFFDSYNELERNKQKLYKGQIIAAGILGELKAIDDKIFDNELARESYKEDIKALLNAKNILIQYVDKCRDKLKKQNEKLISFKAKQEYYKEVDELEFGDTCPVCKGKVLDKTDMSIDNTRVFSNITKQEEEIAKTTLIMDEYNDKLEKINIRLGNLSTKEQTSANYIESLKSTKEAKIKLRDNTYAECGVKSHEELTTKLEESIKKIVEFSARLAKINQVAGLKNFALESAKMLDKHIETTEKEDIPKIKEQINALKEDIKNFSKAYTEISKRLEGKTATEKLEAIRELESKEDVYNDRINVLIAEIEDTEAKIYKLVEEIDTLKARKGAAVIEGKSYDYEGLLIKLAGKRYQEIMSEIRRLEAKRQVSQDEFVAIKRVITDKKASFEEKASKIDELLKQAEVNTNYIDSLNRNSNFTPTELNGKNIESLRKLVLSEEDKISMQQILDEHTLRTGSLSYQCDALKTRLDNGKELLENFKKNCDEYKALQEELYQKEDDTSVLIKELAIAEKLSEKINELQLKKTEKDRAMQSIDSAVNEVLSEELVAHMNNMLRKLGQKYWIKEDGKSLIVVYNDRKGVTKQLEKMDEETKTILSIAVTDAIDIVVGNILDVSYLPRILSIKASALSEDVKAALGEEANKKAMIVLLNK